MVCNTIEFALVLNQCSITMNMSLTADSVTLSDARSYIPPVQIDEIMRGASVGVIVASKSQKFPVGSYAHGQPGWTEIAVIKEKHLEKIDVPKNGKVTDTLGVLGKFRSFNRFTSSSSPDLLCFTHPKNTSRCKPKITMLILTRIDWSYCLLWHPRRW
jgi:hypothetical protein